LERKDELESTLTWDVIGGGDESGIKINLRLVGHGHADTSCPFTTWDLPCKPSLSNLLTNLIITPKERRRRRKKL